MKSINYLVLLTSVSARILAQSVPSTAAVAGTVIDGSGHAIANGKFTYIKQNEYTRDGDGRISVRQLGLTATAIAGSDGTFTVLGLPAGRYQFCGLPTKPSQVSDCTWRGISVIEVSAGQVIKSLTPQVLDGTIITITVSDPNSRIVFPDLHGNVASFRSRFFLGVSAGTYYQRTTRMADSNLQHVFQVVIPKQQPVHLFIDSDLSITDLAGSSVETKKPTTLEIAPGNTDQLSFALLVK